MPLDASYDGYRIKYRHSDQSFVMVAPPSSSPPSIVAGYTTYTLTTSTLSRVINTPTYAIGDYIFVVYCSDGDGDTPALATYTELGYILLDSGSGTMNIFYKHILSSEPSTLTVTNTVAEKCTIMAWAVRDMSAFDNTGLWQVGALGTPTWAAMSTGVNDALHILVAGSFKAATPYGTISGYTKMGEVSVSSGGSIAVFYKLVPTAGVQPSVSTSQTTTETLKWGTAQFSVKN